MLSRVTSCGGSSRSRPLGAVRVCRERGAPGGGARRRALLRLRLGYGTGARGADEHGELLVSVSVRRAAISGAQRLRLERFCPGGGGHKGRSRLAAAAPRCRSLAGQHLAPRFRGPLCQSRRGDTSAEGKCLPGVVVAARFRELQSADTRVQRPTLFIGNPHHSARLVPEVNLRLWEHCLPPGLSTRRQSGFIDTDSDTARPSTHEMYIGGA